MGDFFAAIADILTTDVTYIGAVSVAAFLAFGAAGEWVAERSGTLNISVEGMFLAGAFAAAAAFDAWGNSVVAGGVAALAGLAVAGVQANMSHRLAANQFVVGLTLNILVLGLASFLDSELAPVTKQIDQIRIPLLADIPLLGEALFDRTWMFFLIYPLVPFCWWIVYRTRWGLELRAAGENPQSADVSGIDVNKRRREGIYFVGLTSGFGGAFVLLATVGQFEDSIIGGRGFIALAAVIFGGWTLKGTIGGCLLFGAVISFRLSLQALQYEVNGDLMASLPFVVTILAMTIFAKRVREPAALAQPFIRGLK